MRAMARAVAALQTTRSKFDGIDANIIVIAIVFVVITTIITVTYGSSRTFLSLRPDPGENLSGRAIAPQNGYRRKRNRRLTLDPSADLGGWRVDTRPKGYVCDGSVVVAAVGGHGEVDRREREAESCTSRTRANKKKKRRAQTIPSLYRRTKTGI
jgi:hypothetical protein